VTKFELRRSDLLRRVIAFRTICFHDRPRHLSPSLLSKWRLLPPIPNARGELRIKSTARHYGVLSKRVASNVKMRR
jgi:hypothetical protein